MTIQILLPIMSSCVALLSACRVSKIRKFSRGARDHILFFSYYFSLCLSGIFLVCLTEGFIAERFSAGCQILVCIEIGLFCPAIACYGDKIRRVLVEVDSR